MAKFDVTVRQTPHVFSDSPGIYIYMRRLQLVSTHQHAFQPKNSLRTFKFLKDSRSRDLQFLLSYGMAQEILIKMVYRSSSIALQFCK